MTDYAWPDDLVPYQVAFYLQPQTGGTESPFSRVTKVYGLSAPRWVCRAAFRGGHWGTGNLDGIGPRLDAALAVAKGRLNRMTLFDFRRSSPRSPQWPSTASNLSAAIGATSITITNLPPGLPVYAGDYFGGDGRPHIFTSPTFGLIAAVANSSGQAVVTFEPPLAAAIGAGVAVFSEVRGTFRLTNDDAGGNDSTVGEAANIMLEFVEDL